MDVDEAKSNLVDKAKTDLQILRSKFEEGAKQFARMRHISYYCSEEVAREWRELSELRSTDWSFAFMCYDRTMYEQDDPTYHVVTAQEQRSDPELAWHHFEGIAYEASCVLSKLVGVLSEARKTSSEYIPRQAQNWILTLYRVKPRDHWKLEIASDQASLQKCLSRISGRLQPDDSVVLAKKELQNGEQKWFLRLRAEENEPYFSFLDDLFHESAVACDILISELEAVEASGKAKAAQGFLSTRELADMHGIKNRDALRKQLDRFRKKHALHTDAFIESQDRGKNKPKYLYKEEMVAPILRDLKEKEASTKHPSEKK